MNRFKNWNLNLGFPHLLTEWKSFFSTKYLSNDITAGISVAFVAIPLSLAIALASGVNPASGLVTAIIAGIVCALFGGTPLAVSGPAAAMTVLLADTVEKFGVQGLILSCLIVGMMQLLSGVFGFGKLGRYVPFPVIAGFTAGIGVIIIIGQLPRAFGLLPPPESQTFDVFIYFKDYIHKTNLACLVIVFLTIFIIRGLPKLLPRLPAILLAVAASTTLVYFLKIDVPLIGNIPRSLPSPHIPLIPNVSLNDLFLNAFAIYLLASLETLLSCSAIDKLTSDKKHNSDQELIGQGIGNIAVSLFGGIPVTSVIARSVTNLRAGAKTRRASIIHSLIILSTILLIAPVISLIPIAALAGVLFSIAFSMIDYREFHKLWITTRTEALIYVVTFATIVFVDLIAGVQAGLVAAGLIVLLKAAKTQLHITTATEDEAIRFSLTGSLTFLSNGEMTELEKSIEQAHSNQVVILDLSGITNMDSTGASGIIDLFRLCTEKNIKFYIKGLAKRFESLVKICGGEAIIDDHYLISEKELKKKEISPSFHSRLIHGIQRFYVERKENHKRLYEYIAQTQDPHTLFITCSDSRVVPSEMTSTDPGELFIIRNVGNYIPPYYPNSISSEAAAIEFALNHLDISDIVICGHANCGAIRACCDAKTRLAPKLQEWIDLIKSQLIMDKDLHPDEFARMNVLNQIENLKKYPTLLKKLEENSLKIHAWFFDMDQSLIYEWDVHHKDFKPILHPQTLTS